MMGRFDILNLINKLHPLLGAERCASYFEALPETASSMPTKANFRQMMLVSQTNLEENPMKIIETKQRSPLLIAQLTDLWEKSVRATHFFLSATEIQKIKTYVKPALSEIPHLIVAENEQNIPVAFMGIAEPMIEMLFVTPEQRGHGLGRQLIQYGIANYAIKEVAVNEQNPQAKGFYERMGFKVYKRTDHDEQGNPYPILYMKLQS